MKIIDRLIYWWASYSKVHATVKDCMGWNLIWVEDLHGDAINWMGCRSLWKDKYGNFHRCNRLYKTSFVSVMTEYCNNTQNLLDHLAEIVSKTAAEKRAKNQQQ
jgi:hypothetical protein